MLYLHKKKWLGDDLRRQLAELKHGNLDCFQVGEGRDKQYKLQLLSDKL